MKVYSAIIRQYFNCMDHVGRLENDLPYVAHGQSGKPLTGNWVVLSFQTDARGYVIDSKFKTYGCGVAIAASAWIAECLIDKSLAELQQITAGQIIEFFDLPPLKHHCALLVEEALKAAIKDWERRYGNSSH